MQQHEIKLPKKVDLDESPMLIYGEYHTWKSFCIILNRHGMADAVEGEYFDNQNR